MIHRKARKDRKERTSKKHPFQGSLPFLRAPRALRGSFTLVEMLVVLGIISLVFAMSLPMLIPMMRGRKLDSAADVVKSACVAARSKAVQERKKISLTLLEAERVVVMCDYDALAAAAPGHDPAKPFSPQYLMNYTGADDEARADNRWTVMEAQALEEPRELPEGCRFDFTNLITRPAWTYIFLPNGSVWTLPPEAQNKQDLWSLTTYIQSGVPAGPRISGPEDRSSVQLIVYATTGQAVTE